MNGVDGKELFSLFDKDESGRINVEEFSLGIRSQGVPLTDADIKKLFDEADTTKQGSLSLEEFEGSRAKVKESQATEEHTLAEELTEIFYMLDRDKSGYLDREELSNLIGTFGDKMNDAELSKLFGGIDGDHDGKISLKEFLLMHGQKAETLPTRCQYALTDAKKSLKQAETKVRERLKTQDEMKIEVDEAAKHRQEAEEKLQAQAGKLKKVDTNHKQVLPKAECIEAEKSAAEQAEAALLAAKGRLRTTSTEVRSRLPTAEDLKTEGVFQSRNQEIIGARRSLSLKKVDTVEKSTLPSKEDIDAEKNAPKEGAETETTS